MKGKFVVLKILGKEVNFRMNELPVRAKVGPFVKKGFYCIYFKLDRDKGEKVHAKSCEGRLEVDGSRDDVF